MALAGNNTTMRLRYLASERGEHLTSQISGGNETFTVIRAYDRGSVYAPGSSVATVKGHYTSIDPTASAMT